MEYWDIVKNCLVGFHEFTPQKANNSIERYFKRLKGDQKVIDLVSKEEAFYIAARLAGKPQKELTKQEDAIYQKFVKG